VYTRDEETGEKYKVRKYHYKFSIRQLYNEFKKPVKQGGFDGFQDEKGEMKMHAKVPEKDDRFTERNAGL
jgi:hypothetical protein